LRELAELERADRHQQRDPIALIVLQAPIFVRQRSELFGDLSDALLQNIARVIGEAGVQRNPQLALT
jgi:hypothetical protein